MLEKLSTRDYEMFVGRLRRDETGCVLWTGPVDKGGYGLTKVGRKTVRIHRLAWMVWVGEIPEGAHVLHRCDVRNCGNFDHLFLGNNATNMADKKAKKRDANCRKTHCPEGHELAGENLREYDAKQGKRRCKVCERDYNTKYARARRAASVQAVH